MTLLHINRPSSRVEALSDAKLSRLARHLDACAAAGAMSLEEVDGFYAALIAGPVRTGPREHWQAVFGYDMNALPDDRRAHLDEMLDLLTHHWNAIEDTLAQGLLLGPSLLEDEAGHVRGYAWARGFLRGLAVHHGQWQALTDDEARSAALEPMLALAGNEPSVANPSMADIAKSRRADLLTDTTLALAFLFHHFRPVPPVSSGTAEPPSLH